MNHFQSIASIASYPWQRISLWISLVVLGSAIAACDPQSTSSVSSPTSTSSPTPASSPASSSPTSSVATSPSSVTSPSPSPAANPAAFPNASATTTASSPAASATPSLSTAQAVDYNQPVPLEVGQTEALSGTLKPSETIHFILVPKTGQKMTVQLEGTGLKMAILDQSNQVIAEKEDLTQWEGTATYSGQYYVRLVPTPGATQSDYKIKLGLQAK
jgi:hypothetical protein